MKGRQANGRQRHAQQKNPHVEQRVQMEVMIARFDEQEDLSRLIKACFRKKPNLPKTFLRMALLDVLADLDLQ
jgi:hypothetical protein